MESNCFSSVAFRKFAATASAIAIAIATAAKATTTTTKNRIVLKVIETSRQNIDTTAKIGIKDHACKTRSMNERVEGGKKQGEKMRKEIRKTRDSIWFFFIVL